MVKALRVLLVIAVLLVSVTSVAALPQWMVSLFGMCDDSDNGRKNKKPHTMPG